VDDPKFRFDSGRCDSTCARAHYAGNSSLALFADLHYRLVAVLGSEPPDRGVDGSQADAASGANYVMKAEI